ncbi:hypothetical protein LJC63_07010 [Ruminococcaceae bacterium OttesenSCG-928-L11]|nr:hypothetical protein [Ruminococcaceae bacterium OttesenSCG-928-L11]
MVRSSGGGARRRYYARYLSHYTKKNYAVIGLGCLFLTGVLLGAVLLGYAGGETLEFLTGLTEGYVERRQAQSVMENFASSCTSSLLFVGILFMSGFSAIAQPVEIALPFFRGLGYGFSIASLYAAYSSGTTGFVCLYLMPNMAISTIAILFCAREAVRMSNGFYRALRMTGPDSGMYSLRIYGARFFVGAFACVLSALLESFTFYSFANLVVLR